MNLYRKFPFVKLTDYYNSQYLAITNEMLGQSLGISYLGPNLIFIINDHSTN